MTTGFTAPNTNLVLGADRSIARLTFGGGATQVVLSAGATLRLNRTNTTAGAGTALWNRNSTDGVGGIVNANLLLSCGIAGAYAGHFREDNNARGDTGRFSGSITQGAGESWTLQFSRASSRGNFFLYNPSNNVAGLRNDGADLYSMTPGAFGSALLTLNGGITGVRGVEHYTSPVTNPVTVTANSDWSAGVAARLTANVTQGALRLRYLGGAATRLDYASLSGSGETVIGAAPVAPASMSQFASGTLTLGSIDTTYSGGTLVLGSGDVPSWADFASVRTYAAGGGAGTWRLLANSVSDMGGGLAARGADLTVTAGSAGMTTNTFNQNLTLGTTATLPDGSRFANQAVRIAQDTTFSAAAQRGIWLAGSCAKSNTEWTIAGPVHELSGRLQGQDLKLALMSVPRDGNNVGLLRLSGSNTFAGASSLVIGGKRSNFTTVAGRTFTTANGWDTGGAVLIVTSDSALGGADEVLVFCVASDTGAVGSMLLLEDTNSVGGTAFAKGFTITNAADSTRGAGFGSYAGAVLYTGAVLVIGGYGAGDLNLPIHVQSGTLTLGGASAAAVTINHSRPAKLNKGGPGTLALANLAIGGTQGSADWVVYNGALRETGTGSADSAADRNVSLRGGVLEFGSTPRALTLGTGNGQLNLSAGGGGGFAAYGAARTVALNAGAALTWASTAQFLAAGQPLVLGSLTADAPLDLTNALALNGAGRTVRTVGNPASAADRGRLSGALSGNASSHLLVTGNGVLELASACTYAGNTVVSNTATLLVSGSLDAQASAVTVLTNATLGGTGTIARAVTVADGGRLLPGTSAGTLTVSNLTLSAGSVCEFELGTASDQVVVTGALTLDGTLNVTNGPGYGPGIYVLMIYGSLTDNGLTLGTTPPGYNAELSVGGGQVRLIVGDPEAAVLGGGYEIPNGAAVPALTNDTDFGAIAADGPGGAFADRVFTITNQGPASLSLFGTPLVALQGLGTNSFSVVSQPATNLLAGYAAAAFTVRFDPAAIGASSVTVSIACTDPDEDPYTFALRGTGSGGSADIAVLGTNGVEIADGDAAPETADGTDFGVLTAGFADHVFTITNAGGANLNLSGSPVVQVSGTHTTDFVVVSQPGLSTLTPGDTTTFTLRFNPTALGLRQATVEVGSDDTGENPYDFAVQGTYAGPEIAVLGTNGAEIASGDATPDTSDGTDFGSLAALGATRTHTFVVTNSGSAALVLSGSPAVAVTGAHAADFTVTAQPSPTNVGTGSAVTFDLRFDPSAAGLRSATVSIVNSDASETPYTFAVQGTGLVPAMTVRGLGGNAITDGDASPAMADGTDFGGTEPGSTASRTFTITNSGAVDLALTGTPAVVLSGPQAAAFTVVAQPSPTTVAGGGAGVTFTVEFAPTNFSLSSATVSVANTDPARDPYDFAIQGLGVSPDRAWDNGAGDGSWNSAANWSPDALPNSRSQVALTSSLPATITLDAAQSISNLTYASASNVTIAAGAGGSLAVAEGLVKRGSGQLAFTANPALGGAAVVSNGTLFPNLAAPVQFGGSATPIVLAGGTLSYDRETSCTATSAVPGLSNAVVVTTSGGTLSIPNSGANNAAVTFNAVELAGALTLTSAGGGNSFGMGIAGPVTLDQQAAAARRIASQTGHNGDDYLWGNVADGAGGAGNPLRLSTANRDLHVAGTANTYAGGSVIESGNGVVHVDAPSSLGAGNVTIENNGRVVLNGGTNGVAPAATITVQTGGVLAVAANASLAPRVAAASAGIYAVEGTTTYALNLAALGNGRMFLGSINGGTYSGTLTPGAGAVYRLGGGRTSLSDPPPTPSRLVLAAGVLTGSASVQVGSSSGELGGSDSSHIALGGAQSFSGGADVRSGWLTTAASNHAAFGSGRVVVRSGARLGASGTAGSLWDGATQFTNYTLRPGAALVLSESNGNVPVAHGGRWGDAAGMALDDHALYVYSALNNTYAEAMGGLSLAGRGHLNRAAGGGTSRWFGDWAQLARHGRGVLTVIAELNTSPGSDARLRFAAPPAVSNGMVAAWLLDTSLNNFLTYDSATDANGVIGLKAATYTSTNVLTSAAADLVNDSSTRTLAASREVYALRRTGGDLTISAGAVLTLGGGGLLTSGNTRNFTGAGALDVGAEGLVYNSGTTVLGVEVRGQDVTKFGGGTLRLEGTNTFSGALTVLDGTVRVDAGTGLPRTNTLYVGHYGTFNLSAAHQTVGDVAGHGTVALGGRTLTVHGTLSPGNTNGVAAGTLTISGTGVVAFAAGARLRLDLDEAGFSDAVVATNANLNVQGLQAALVWWSPVRTGSFTLLETQTGAMTGVPGSAEVVGNRPCGAFLTVEGGRRLVMTIKPQGALFIIR